MVVTEKLNPLITFFLPEGNIDVFKKKEKKQSREQEEIYKCKQSEIIEVAEKEYHR